MDTSETMRWINICIFQPNSFYKKVICMLGLIQAIKYDLYAYNSYFVICPSKYRIRLRRYQTSVSEEL